MSRRPAHALASLFLLAVMAMQLVQVASFEVRRTVLRKEMKQRIRQGLPQHELVRFTFSPAQYASLRKEDGGREFRLDGHLYDVVRCAEEADGTIYIEAVDDRDEARLMAGLDDLLQADMARKSMGRDRARTIVVALACSLPVAQVRLAAPDALDGLRVPVHGALVLERATGELLVPPRG